MYSIVICIVSNETMHNAIYTYIVSIILIQSYISLYNTVLIIVYTHGPSEAPAVVPAPPRRCGRHARCANGNGSRWTRVKPTKTGGRRCIQWHLFEVMFLPGIVLMASFCQEKSPNGILYGIFLGDFSRQFLGTIP